MSVHKFVHILSFVVFVVYNRLPLALQFWQHAIDIWTATSQAVWGFMPKTPSSRRIFRERLKLFAGPNHLYYNKDRLLQVEPHNIERRVMWILSGSSGVSHAQDQGQQIFLHSAWLFALVNMHSFSLFLSAGPLNSDVMLLHVVQWAMMSVRTPVCLMPSMMASITTAGIHVSKTVRFQCKTCQLDPELAMTAETSATVSCSEE